MPKNEEIDRIRRIAEGAFANHELRKMSESGLFRSFRCAAPNRWAYGFDVTFIPGYVFLTGDLGCLVLCRVDDMIPWLRTTLTNSIDFNYVAEKAPGGLKTRVRFGKLSPQFIWQALALQWFIRAFDRAAGSPLREQTALAAAGAEGAAP